MIRLLTLVALAALVTACSSLPKPIPKSGPEEVELFDINQGTRPEGRFRSLGEVIVEIPLATSTVSDLMTAILAEAAPLGADGVVLQDISRVPPGDRFTEEMYRARGMAIYWPDRVPQPDTPENPED